MFELRAPVDNALFPSSYETFADRLFDLRTTCLKSRSSDVVIDGVEDTFSQPVDIYAA